MNLFLCLGVLCVRVKINKRLFEPVCVWIFCLNGLGCLVVSDEDADVSDVFWIDCWYNCEDEEPDDVPW